MKPIGKRTRERCDFFRGTKEAAMSLRFFRVNLGLLILVFGVVPSAVAQDAIQWHRDYAQARDQAAHSGLPILIEVGATWCLPCKKMDATTFRDPRIVRLVNTRYVPVKLDGDHDQDLVKNLRVDMFPTVILAHADGSIIRRLSGFQTAEQLLVPLNETVALATGPRPVVRSGAAELLAQAKRDHAARFDLACLERCFAILREHPNTPEASEAARMVLSLRGDPDRLRQALGRLELLTGVPAASVTQVGGER
jgi:thiol-disulfide isomerase/thioredoxin